jgi:hypothetical protein
VTRRWPPPCYTLGVPTRPGELPAARPARGRLRWALATGVGVLLPALLLLIGDHRFFFYGDTQAAYVGWEYHLGRQLLEGHWPLVDPQAWRAGNFAAEGQAGLFDPLVMVIGLAATTAGNVLVFATVVKLALAVAGGCGVAALARSYGARAPLACVAGVAAPLGGMSQYLDLPSWLAGLMIWALLPWVWWALRRTVVLGANPWPVLALGYLLVTVGYVYGTIMLILVLIASLAETRAARDRIAALEVLGVGGLLGLVALTVYLPGVLTAPVTIRGSGFALTGKFGSDPLQLLTSVIPSAALPGITLHVLPYAYVAWFLPLLAWVDLRRLREGWRPVAGLLVMTLLVLAWVLGPARMGPLRWPLRLQPFLVECLVVVCAVALSRYGVRQPSPRRLLAALGWVAVAAVVSLLRYPDGWAPLLVSAAVVAVGVVALWRVARGPRTDLALARGAAVAVLVSVVSMLLQHAAFHPPPSPERNLPAATADYRRQLTAARGDVMVVGDAAAQLKAHPAASADLLDGAAWYLDPDHPTQSTYTTIGFRRFMDRYGTYYDGSTPPAALDALFSTEPRTGRRRVDLLAVSTLLLVRADFPPARLMHPPSGWRVARSAPYAVTWVRTSPVPGAGHVAWSSPGTTVSRVRADERTTRFVVDRVPAGGGTVVLSLLDWPGYRTDVGTVSTSVDGYLLTLRLPAGAAGTPVTVRFSPPGWPLEVGAWWLAVVAGVGWSVLAWRRRAR